MILLILVILAVYWLTYVAGRAVGWSRWRSATAAFSFGLVLLLWSAAGRANHRGH